MSRVGKKPIQIPANIEIKMAGQKISIKGPKGTEDIHINELVTVKFEDKELLVSANEESQNANALSGTMRALIANLIHGVTDGYEVKLVLVGVGYRAQVQGDILNLTLGFSHPVRFQVPPGVTIEAPIQTEIVIKGIKKDQVGQVAAEIRRFRPPEPYKGKGIRYAGEVIILKETKKK